MSTPVYDTIGKTYDTTRNPDPVITKMLLELLCPHKKGRYLDIGCGSGNYTGALAAMGLVIEGIDLSLEMLTKARKKHPHILFHQGNVRQLDFQKDLFNGAVCILATHHIGDNLATFQECYRVIKEGGLVIFTATPEQMRNYWLWHYFPNMMQQATSSMTSFTELKTTLEQAGFHTIKKQPFFVSNELQDWFLQAGKYRPEIYLDKKVRDGISSFHLFATPDEGGDVIQEEIFKGPLDHQLRSALRHIQNNFISERVIKFPDKAEAKRFFNYPYDAIEEALVNAVYHRCYEIREPIEVRINPKCIRIVSHPGADPSVSFEDVKSGLMVTRRYRNRRIGEFLKELDFTEGRGTGIPKMRRALAANGSPAPLFFTDSARLSFCTEIKIHPEFLKEYTPAGVHDGVHDQILPPLSQTELKILHLAEREPISRAKILAYFGYQVVTRNIRNAINKLLQFELIVYTIPEKPKSKGQKYKITQKGKVVLKSKSNF